VKHSDKFWGFFLYYFGLKTRQIMLIKNISIYQVSTYFLSANTQ
jgi:hypothetical protein